MRLFIRISRITLVVIRGSLSMLQSYGSWVLSSLFALHFTNLQDHDHRVLPCRSDGSLDTCEQIIQRPSVKRMPI